MSARLSKSNDLFVLILRYLPKETHISLQLLNKRFYNKICKRIESYQVNLLTGRNEFCWLKNGMIYNLRANEALENR